MITFILVVLILRLIHRFQYRIKTVNGIDESRYVNINGIKQYILIRGNDRTNPVILFIHGGPASPMGFVAPYYQRELEQDYTIVYYDQRGCGRTYYANAKQADPTPEQLLADVDAMVDYIRQYLEQEQVIIMGHSWGTILGITYVQMHPDKVAYYIGVSQIMQMYRGKILLADIAYCKAADHLTKKEADILQTVARMEKVIAYEKLSIHDLAVVTHFAARYLSVPGEMSGLRQMWAGLTSPYMSFRDIKWFTKQLNTAKFFEMERRLMEYAFFDFDVEKLPQEYKVPVYFIGGEGDYSIPQNLVRRYCEEIQAPDKDFYMIDNVGHSMFMDNPYAFCDIVKRIGYHYRECH